MYEDFGSEEPKILFEHVESDSIVFATVDLMPVKNMMTMDKLALRSATGPELERLAMHNVRAVQATSHHSCVNRVARPVLLDEPMVVGLDGIKLLQSVLGWAWAMLAVRKLCCIQHEVRLARQNESDGTRPLQIHLHIDMS